MEAQELNKIFDELESLAQKALAKQSNQADIAQHSFELEREVRKLQTENSLLKDRNNLLQENQKMQSRLRGILDKMENQN